MKSRLPFVFIIFTVMLDAMGIGLLMPVLPDLISALDGGSLADAARWGGLLAFTYAGMQFLFGPLVGALSDRFGRRPILLISLVGMGLAYVITAFAPYLWLLFVARVVSGITGATYSTANAYVADISPRDKRAANFGLVGLGFGIGFILGPAMGGYLGQFGYQAPVIAAAALSFANAIFGFFVMPETLKSPRPIVWKEADPIRAVMKVRSLPGLGPLLLILFLYTIAHNIYPAIWAFFTIERFAWDVNMVGISLAAFGICMAIVQGGLMRIILAKIGDYGTAVFGLTIDMLVFGIIMFVTQTWQIFMLMPVMALGVVVGPALNGIMANATPDDRQGALQGVLASLQGIAAILSPLLMTNLFSAFSGEDAPIYLPAAPFLAAGVLTAICLGLLVRARGARVQDTITSKGS
ncbi:DHA1 family tetracycline resistance protein-like MFS transporter [Rubricella aquisinus]|uniref:DHA1 family tetracycline resistance protein-like MFS transporter n=1 Tax=Rubricella aquisinus TaxID=2028108 RepID=A0A840WKM4_9RHOB|nr:TCR/Tet family MFS transporter [Rubricella aquisinus]MBB5515071.1 DHA1 family tetracycline resistance protein-like MFS transporter [Rubricella aquisinus]